MNLFRNITNAVKRFFPKKKRKIVEDKDPSSKIGGDASVKTTLQKTVALKHLEKQLRNLLAQSGPMMAGRIQVLMLDEIRNRLGAKWDRLCDQVNLVVERIIKTHTGPKDLFYPHGDLEYLLIFTDLTSDEAAQKCKIIRDEIYNALFGEPASTSDGLGGGVRRQDVKITTAVTSVTDAIEMIPVQEESDLLGSLQHTLEKLSWDEEAPVQNQDGKPETHTNAKLGEQDPSWKTTTHLSNVGRLQNDTSHKKDTNNTNWISGDISEDDVLKPLIGLQYVFRPIWNSDTKSIRFFSATPLRRQLDGQLATGYSAIGQGAHEKSYAALDKAVLSWALESLSHLSSVGADVQIMTPVHFKTVASSQNLRLFREACGAIPESLRQNLVFEFVGFPSGITLTELHGAIGGIRRFAAGASVRVDIKRPKFTGFKESGVSMVGFSLTGINSNDEQFMDAMERIVAASASENIGLYALDMPSKNIATAAIGVGVSLIGSPFISSISNIPDELKRFDIAHLFGDNVYLN